MNSIFKPSLREVKNWLARLVSEGQKKGLQDQSQSGKILVMETSLTDMFFTFARLVSVKVENQSDHVLPPTLFLMNLFLTKC